MKPPIGAQPEMLMFCPFRESAHRPVLGSVIRQRGEKRMNSGPGFSSASQIIIVDASVSVEWFGLNSGKSHPIRGVVRGACQDTKHH